VSRVPAVSYLICTTPRSGSWLLCDALTQTGVAGYPQEYLLSHTVFDRRWGKPTQANFGGYFSLVRQEATTPNGVCGLKVHWSQIQHLLNVLHAEPSELLEQLHDELPGLVLIRLIRRDKLRQALSYHRALAQQQWWQLAGEPTSPAQFVPDLDQVERLADLLEAHERSWDDFALAAPAPLLELSYEELAADLHGEVFGVLRALGCDAQEAWSAASAVSPRLRRQSDERTELWVHQFISRRRSGPLPPEASSSREAI
jgi:LPS sulfotransferase NodH